MKRLLLSYGHYLAIGLALAGVCFYLFSKPPAAQTLQSDDFQPEKEKLAGILDEIKVFGFAGAPQTREDSLAAALDRYAAADYAGARQALDALLAVHPDDHTARFYRGMCALYHEAPDEALAILLPLTDMPNFALHDEARWYAALAATRADPVRALGLFSSLSEDPNSRYRPAAKAILKAVGAADRGVGMQFQQGEAFRYALALQPAPSWWQTEWMRILMLALLLTGAVAALFWRRRIWQLEREKAHLGAEKELSESLLLNILPAETAEELKKFGHSDTRRHEMVTVLFCDFQGFTNIAEMLAPEELVDYLRACFEAFDRIVTAHHLEKIKTVGDCYICAAGLKPSDEQPGQNARDNAVRSVQTAQDMLAFLQQFNDRQVQQGKPAFKARIGIHTGAVVAGIVGIKKYSYDIWGDTVNIAARMEQSGEGDRINISGSTYELVKDRFTCQYRGKVDAKGKGAVDMYFVG